MNGLPPYLAETSIGLAVFYLLHPAFLRQDTHFHLSRFYLLASLVAAHLLPLLHVTSPFRRAVVPPAPLEALDLAPLPAAGWSWPQALVALYVLGAAAVLLRLGWHLWQIAVMMRRHPGSRQDGLRVIYVDEDCPPFSFFRTVFVHRPSPGGERDVDQVVAHERTHIRQGHSFDILLVQLAAAGQWFNPFIWFYKDALRELHEFLADREVLARGYDPSVYTHILLAHHLGARSFELAHHLRHSQIRRRLAMMTHQSGPWTICKYLLALPAIAVLVIAFADPRIMAADGAAASAPPPPVVTAQEAVAPAQAADQKKKAEKAEQAKLAEKEINAVELKKKQIALKEEDAATSDPVRKKDIEAKMKQLEEMAASAGNPPAAKLKVDLSDPAAIEEVIAKVSQKLESLKAKINETSDPTIKAKLQQDGESLIKTRSELKAKLAELRAGKQK